MCSLSWREPKKVKRPLVATVDVAGPFQVAQRPWTLKPKDRKPLVAGPKVRVEAVRLKPSADENGLLALANGAGLRDWDKDGLREQDTRAASSWQGAWSADLSLEFELPEAVPLAAIEVWNYNANWQPTNGLRKANIAVSADGVTWKTVLRHAEFAQADGTDDYDEPTVLKLNGRMARKVRFENLVPWSANGKVGLSGVVFRAEVGPQAGLLQPEDGAIGVRTEKLTFEWLRGWGAAQHQVFLGTTPNALEKVGTSKETRLTAPALKPGATYYWRVDELQCNGKVTTGRIARFETAPGAGGATAASLSGYMR